MSLPPVALPGIPEHRTDAPDIELPSLGELHTKEPEPSEPLSEAPRRKRKYTRRVGAGVSATESEPSEAGAVEPTPEELGALKQAVSLSVDFFGRYMAAKRGQHWLVQAEESALLGEAWSNALAPYMATFAKATPMILAVVVTAGVFGPRLQQDAMNAEAEAAQSAQRPGRKEKTDAKNA